MEKSIQNCRNHRVTTFCTIFSHDQKSWSEEIEVISQGQMSLYNIHLLIQVSIFAKHERLHPELWIKQSRPKVKINSELPR